MNSDSANVRMFTSPHFRRAAFVAIFLLNASLTSWGQTEGQSALSYSVATPRPINPAESTTNPSAQATQSQNPYLGSVPDERTDTTLRLSMRDAIGRGLRHNLGLIEATQASADVRAGRLRALSALLPQISADARQAFESLSFAEIGLKLPSIPGFPGLPPTTGGFGYQDTRVNLTQSIYSADLLAHYRAQKSAERASVLSARDSRDVVVFAVGTAYLQVIASGARLETARAELTSALALDQQTAHQVKAEVSPEIDALRAQVERQSAEQRVTNLANQLEKDKLTFGRITGLATGQDFVLTDVLSYHPLNAANEETALADAFRSRADLASAAAGVRTAELDLRAGRDERLPAVSIHADYGGGGSNVGNFNQVYTLVGSVSVPLYTGGRIHANIEQAQADLARRRAEYADLKGRIAYDVRIAWLDLKASDSSVNVANNNKALAARALTQARDRYANGVTNYLEVVNAEQVVAAASENYIQSLYSFNVSKIALARAMGASESKLYDLLGGN